MNGWNTTPAQQVWPNPSNSWDAMSEDQLLMLWQQKKQAIENAKMKKWSFANIL